MIESVEYSRIVGRFTRNVAGLGIGRILGMIEVQGAVNHHNRIFGRGQKQ